MMGRYCTARHFSASARFGISSSSPRTPLSVRKYSSAETWASSQIHLNRPSKPFLCASSWPNTETLLLSKHSFHDLFLNAIPAIDVPGFLSRSECQRLLGVVETHRMGAYGTEVFPVIESIGITQFEHRKDKEKYFGKITDARSLQKRFLLEAKIDIISRVREILQAATTLPVRIATENDREYFVGLLRCINSSALMHADYAPYDGPSWEIGRVTAQLTWNILLKQINGGETIVYDRLWQGESDDSVFKKPSSYGYSPALVEGTTFKVLPPKEGTLTLFNSRNFHEVKAVDKPQEERRYTISSFIGLLPESASRGPAIILWS